MFFETIYKIRFKNNLHLESKNYAEESEAFAVVMADCEGRGQNAPGPTDMGTTHFLLDSTQSQKVLIRLNS